MENSSLFLAHQNGRRAEAHLRYKRFEEAIKCHEKACALLEQTMQLTRVTRALESLNLQRDFHLKQSDIVRAKKVQFEVQKELLAFRKQKMEKQKSNVEPKENLELAIFRTMEEADSLIGLLTAREDLTRSHVTEGAEDAPPCHPGAGGTGDQDKNQSSWVKHPKDERTVIEELRTVNQQLKALVKELLSQLEASRREVEMLRERLNSTPSTLPELPPLELPQFDFYNSFAMTPRIPPDGAS